MRAILLAAALTTASFSAWAQKDVTDSTPAQTAPGHPMHKYHHHHATYTGGPERPIDVGPNTPEANAAYQGGGVILQGAPGAPAPRPQATPPGQMPANAVPQ